MTVYLAQVRAACATRVALAIYVSAVLLGACVSAGWFPAYVGAVLLALVVVVVILAGTHSEVAQVHLLVNSQRQEVAEVHTLVNSQRDELVARIDQLTRRLLDTGQDVPDDPAAGGPQ